MRHELKYYLNDLQSHSLAQRLRFVLEIDKNGSPLHGYRVRSLYFDSLDDECLADKQAGFLQRKKIRLRTYGDEVGEYFRFEIKHKIGHLVAKESATVSKKDAQRIAEGDHRRLLKYGDPVLDRIYAIFATRTYRPKVIVDYNRLAFTLPALNIRLTLDREMHSNINHLDLFSTRRAFMPVILEGKQILEIKYDNFFPDYLRQLLSAVRTERMAISKYTLARRFFKKSKWEDN